MIREMIEDYPMKNRLIVGLFNQGILCPEHGKPILFHYFTYVNKLINELEAEGNIRGES